MRNIFIAGFLAVLASGCATIQTPFRNQNYDFSSLGSAYVIRHEKSSRDIDLYIQRAFSECGIETSVGPESTKPQGVDVYVTYIDRWQWDMAMYLYSLDISVYDAKNNSMITSGSYRNSWMHTFPNPEMVTRNVVFSMLKKQPNSSASP